MICPCCFVSWFKILASMTFGENGLSIEIHFNADIHSQCVILFLST